jgi:hypothetical protein
MKKWCLALISFCTFSSLAPMDCIYDGEGNALITMNHPVILYKSANNTFSEFTTKWKSLPLLNAQKVIQCFPQEKINQINKIKPFSLVSAMRELPLEITEQIVSAMLDYDKQATEMFMNMPVIDAFQQYQEAKNELAVSPQMNNKSMGMFFRMKEEQKAIVMSTLKPSLKSRLFLNSTVALTEEQLEELQALNNDIRNEFIAGQEISTISKQADNNFSLIIGQISVFLFAFGSGLNALDISLLSNPPIDGAAIRTASIFIMLLRELLAE